MNSFEKFKLPKSIQKALDELGISSPTPIQNKTFKKICSGRDVMGIAQTGTGKTLAYLLPVLKQFEFNHSEYPKILILAPTRELAVQINEEIEKLCRFNSIRSIAIYGGTNINTQKKAICEGVDIIVGTPGRIMDLALDGILRFEEIKKLIIDEFDEMLSLGFKPAITSIVTMLKSKHQSILFSATMTDEVDVLLEELFNHPIEISLAPSGTPLENIKQEKYWVPNFNTKVNLLKNFLKEHESKIKLLVFVNSKRIADLLFERLEEDFTEQFGIIHSNKSQNYRLNTIQSFQKNEIIGIITTDVMARGLDITDITHVINFDIPELPEQYMHRIGRTGRADKSGIAISYISPREEEDFLDIEITMNLEVPEMIIPNEVEISNELIEAEKTKQKIKFLLKKPKLSDNGAFHEKKEKNKKVNLGGPGKRNPKKTKPRNRGTNKSKKR